MKRVVASLIILVVIIAILYDKPKERLRVESPKEIDIRRYADWSVDGVRPGMSLAQAEEACGRAVLLSRIDYFGSVYTLYDGRQRDWMHSGHFVVNEDDQVVSVEGYELKYLGEVQADFPSASESSAEVVEDQCRRTTPMLYDNKYSFQDNPVVVRGDHFVTYILGEEPDWLTLCYRTDELGDCLECLSHLQRLLVQAEEGSIRPQRQEELEEFLGEELIEELQCPLGGAYQINGFTVTCSAHREGPISVTRTGADCRFWRGTPE